MSTFIPERQRLIENVSTLPDEVLVELANFIDYLRYKSTKPKEIEKSGSAFLLSITGLGTSEEHDISERDEEILRAEVDAIRGWYQRPNRSV